MGKKRLRLEKGNAEKVKENEEKGRAAVEAGAPGDYSLEDLETRVTDALANIKHYCMVANIDYAQAESKADYHFIAERYGGEE